MLQNIFLHALQANFIDRFSTYEQLFHQIDMKNRDLDENKYLEVIITLLVQISI